MANLSETLGQRDVSRRWMLGAMAAGLLAVSCQGKIVEQKADDPTVTPKTDSGSSLRVVSRFRALTLEEINEILITNPGLQDKLICPVDGDLIGISPVTRTVKARNDSWGELIGKDLYDKGLAFELEKGAVVRAMFDGTIYMVADSGTSRFQQKASLFRMSRPRNDDQSSYIDMAVGGFPGNGFELLKQIQQGKSFRDGVTVKRGEKLFQINEPISFPPPPFLDVMKDFPIGGHLMIAEYKETKQLRDRYISGEAGLVGSDLSLDSLLHIDSQIVTFKNN